MADIDRAGPPAPRTRRLPAAALVGSGLAAGLALAGLTAASAQSGPTPSPSRSTAPDPAPRDRPGKHGLGHGLGKHGLGPGVLHGELTTEDPAGGYRRMAVQRGEVTAVSATSVTVRSADGYSRTYAVTGDTQVTSADEGIGDVSAGDRVHVLAVLDSDRATAIQVTDTTELGRLRDKWGPRRPGPRGPRATPSS